jgi:hypothetical protein
VTSPLPSSGSRLAPKKMKAIARMITR